MTNRASSAQIEALVEFLEQNPGIAKGLLRTTQGKLETKRKWANLAITLNSIGGASKDGSSWAKYWAEKKSALKKTCSEISASMRRTGGGTAHNIPILSALETRMVAVMGGQDFATGDLRWAVNPFPQPIRPTDSQVHNTIEAIVPQEDTEVDSSRNISPVPGTAHNDPIPASPIIPARSTPLQQSTILPRNRRRRRSSISRPVNAAMEQFTNIEARRVEAELLQAQAFSQAALALTSIANAISDLARKMPNP